MMPALLLGTAVAFVVGLTSVSLLWPVAGRAGPALSALRWVLAMGMGQGITASLLFIFLVVHRGADRTYLFWEALVAVVLVGLCLRRRRRRAAPTAELRALRGSASMWYDGLLGAAFGVAVIAALAAIFIGLNRIPYGDWDAWAIYNLRARLIFRGGADWRDGFSHLLTLSHPDYPPLLPLCVVRAWLYAGGETVHAPRLIGALFATATIGVICFGVAALRGRPQAYVAGVVLLGNTFLIRHAASQYADVPLMFFFAAAAALLVLHTEVVRGEGAGAFALIGMAAGLATWTKNEGALFLAVLAFAHFAVTARTRGLRAYARQLLPLLAGAFPALVMLIYFKLAIAPPSDLVTLVAGQSVFAKLADPGRYVTIARELLQRAPLHDGSTIGTLYLLAFYGLCVGIRARESAGVKQATLTLLLLCAGYLAVYLMTPYDLSWHIATSMDRLLVQVWPTFVFVIFVWLRTPEEIFDFVGKAPSGSAR